MPCRCVIEYIIKYRNVFARLSVQTMMKAQAIYQNLSLWNLIKNEYRTYSLCFQTNYGFHSKWKKHGHKYASFNSSCLVLVIHQVSHIFENEKFHHIFRKKVFGFITNGKLLILNKLIKSNFIVQVEINMKISSSKKAHQKLSITHNFTVEMLSFQKVT